ncbi:MAG: class II aldolase/adducin family protein [Candidatus Lokiarchaeota archaeon]|nr:class II aldolase/adducin family protein [Candidatus Lokiarchaeota archaeon]
MSQDNLDELRPYKEQVLAGAKAIYNMGLVQFGEGNVSVRVKKAEEFFITPSQNDYAKMTIDDVVHMKFDGTPISQGKPTSSEYKLHVAIYQARPKVNCVIHTHSPYASMLGIALKEIPVIFEEMVIFLGGPVKRAPYTQSGTDELGKAALEAMGDTNTCLLTNHAVVACGRDLDKALKAASLVEKTAMIYWGALQIGHVETVPDDKIEKFKDMFKGLFSTAPRKKAE